MLAGQTTLRKAMLQIWRAIALLLVVIFAVIAVANIATVAYKHAGISIASSLFFSLSLVACIAIFSSIGALMSQLFATRAQALRASAVLFGIFFLMRGVAASINGLTWLANLSPLGWIENLRPFTGSHWQWLVPAAISIVVTTALAWWFAGKRDIGASIIKDSENATPRLKLLNSLTTFNFRLMRGTVLGWLAGIAFASVIFGTVAKSAGDAFNSSNVVQNIIGRLTQSSNFGVEMFYGFTSLIFTLMLLLMVTGMIATMREEEAEGYTDNILVRPIGRLSLITSKTFLFIISLVLFSVVTSVSGWLGGISQHAEISLSKLMLAGFNMLAAGVVIIGLCLSMDTSQGLPQRYFIVLSAGHLLLKCWDRYSI
jgi:ABC-2 type transport system permease protein